MSNEYKEWLKDRGEEAMETIAKICDTVYATETEGIYNDYDRLNRIIYILTEDKWL